MNVTAWPAREHLYIGPPNRPNGQFPGGRPARPGAGVQVCERCTYRGDFVRHDHPGGVVIHTCPRCVEARDTDAEYAELIAEHQLAAALKTAGRNDPCPCGSGRKFKKCHGG